jgi:lipopolysaccharide biosynthesis glycosyltransferase
MMFVDSDVLVLDDLKKITEELELKGSDKPIVYMLLRRPQLLSLNDIGWLYLRDAPGLSFQQMADLINETFSLDYSADQLQNVNCWNSGIVYGSPEGIKMLADQWSKYYTVMLTGKNKDSFIPNDQLCLWLAIDHLVDKVTVKELPLAWNFMPGHALEKIMSKATPSLDEIKASLRGVRILHFAQNKADSWVQRLIELAPFS